MELKREKQSKNFKLFRLFDYNKKKSNGFTESLTFPSFCFILDFCDPLIPGHLSGLLWLLLGELCESRSFATPMVIWQSSGGSPLPRSCSATDSRAQAYLNLFLCIPHFKLYLKLHLLEHLNTNLSPRLGQNRGESCPGLRSAKYLQVQTGEDSLKKWFSTCGSWPLWVKWLFHRNHLRPTENEDIYTTIPNSGRTAIKKWQEK